MHLLSLATPTSADSLGAALSQPTAGTNPLDDMARALRGNLGIGLALLAALVVAWAAYRAWERRHRRRWAQDRMIASIAGRGFALYRAAAATPGIDVRALAPSWPVSSGVADLGSPFDPPAPADVQPAPWASWARAPRQ